MKKRLRLTPDELGEIHLALATLNSDFANSALSDWLYDVVSHRDCAVTISYTPRKRGEKKRPKR